MARKPTAGAKLYIADPGTLGTSPLPSPDPWVEIGGVTNYGDISKAWSEVRSNSISERTGRIFKGGRDAPVMTLEVEFDPADSGQAAMEAAYDDPTQDDYDFKMVLNDAPDGGTPTTVTFSAKVMDWSGPNLGGLENMVRFTASLGIDMYTYDLTEAAE